MRTSRPTIRLQINKEDDRPPSNTSLSRRLKIIETELTRPRDKPGVTIIIASPGRATTEIIAVPSVRSNRPGRLRQGERRTRKMITRTTSFGGWNGFEMSFQPAVKREPHTIKFVDANRTVTSLTHAGSGRYASTWTHFEDGIARNNLSAGGTGEAFTGAWRRDSRLPISSRARDSEPPCGSLNVAKRKAGSSSRTANPPLEREC